MWRYMDFFILLQSKRYDIYLKTKATLQYILPATKLVSPKFCRQILQVPHSGCMLPAFAFIKLPSHPLLALAQFARLIICPIYSLHRK